MRKQPVIMQSHKTDLLLINEISRPSMIAQLQAPTNMNQLHNLLKFKNAKSSHSRQEKQNAQIWLNKEGIDISPVVQRVRKAKEINIQKQELKKMEEDCVFYIADMSYKKIEEYEVKASDYATLALIQHNMKKDNFSKKIINKINAKYSMSHKFMKTQQAQQVPMNIFSSISTQPRNEEKRQNYVKCMSLWAKGSLKQEDLASLFSQKLNKKLWAIMANHIKCINQAMDISEDKRIAELYMQSLRMIEDEYKAGLMQHTSEGLNFYLSRQYLDKLDRSEKRQDKYIKDREHGSYWGKAFILYRAGRKGDFYSLLASRNETELLQNFRQVDQSIQQKQPITKDLTVRMGDVFREQLFFALRGQSKYSSTYIANQNTLDFIWVIIRNLGIFYDRKNEEFLKYCDLILNYYSSLSVLNEEQLYNYFYLLAYDKIASIGLSDIMDQDDFVHFMICLNGTPQLLKGKGQNIKLLLKSQLILYIRELISLGKSQYIYYMPFIPQEYRAMEISTILSSSNLVSSFNWDYLSANIPSRAEFEQIVKKTLEKQILTTNDYLSAAEKYTELLNNGEQSVRCLLQFLIKNFSGNSYDDEGAIRAQTACDKYIYLNPQMNPQYRSVLNFLIECRRLLKLVRERQEVEIYNLVNNSQYVMVGSLIPQQHLNLLDMLIELSGTGLDAYFKFIKTVITGIQIYFTRKNDIPQEVQFVKQLQENVRCILAFEQYQGYIKRQETSELYAAINSVVAKK